MYTRMVKHNNKFQNYFQSDENVTMFEDLTDKGASTSNEGKWQ